jgi:hypothetical protein
LQRLYQLFVEGFIEVVDRTETTPSSESETATAKMNRAAVMDSPTDLNPSEGLPSLGLDGIVPTALPPQFIHESRNLSSIEKYLLTLCDGTRDLKRITTVAPIQSRVVVATIQSLSDRGWLSVNPAGADH